MLNKTLESLESLKSALMQTSLCDDDIVSAGTLGTSVHIWQHAIQKAVNGVKQIHFWVDGNSVHFRWRVGDVGFVATDNSLNLDKHRNALSEVEFVDESAVLAGV